MLQNEIMLSNPERWFTGKKINISKNKLEKAAEEAVKKLEKNIENFGTSFIDSYSVNHKYKTVPFYPDKDSYWRYWTNGMYTGEFLLAYELTGDNKFLDVAVSHHEYYAKRVENLLGLDDHDVGFLYSPSCVAAYKITGDTRFRNTALKAAEILYERFSHKGKYLRRAGDDKSPREDWHRTMVDAMLNIPLFMWASKETSDDKYMEAAKDHCSTTSKLLVKEDGSTYHHYQFDPQTQEPVGGVSFQGDGNDGCWSRGHSWTVYGFPIAYSYIKNDDYIPLHKSLSYYFLNNLPADGIPYWDFKYHTGSSEPRDSSAAAIAVCGLLEMNKYLKNDEPQKEVFENASAYMMNSLIDKCTDISADGLLIHSSAAVPQGFGIEECTIYGDYFYLEALTRYLKPDWNRYW
ncbi:MAG: glycoside hydrolase family 88 protein [Clostridia bacterium]|nr:glycoside hydrolase family 88 protein [Clostridia bacterium]